MSTKTSEQTGRKNKRGWVPYAVMVLFALYVLTNCRIIVAAGPSMKPTYTQGDLLFCTRSWTVPKPGSAVLIQKDGVLMIKRIVYTAGDDAAGQQWYDDANDGTPGSDTDLYWGGTVVPEGYVFVVGDNPSDSYDSRYKDFGLVPIEDIWGIVLLKF